jgi:predicted Zn-dependent protease
MRSAVAAICLVELTLGLSGCAVRNPASTPTPGFNLFPKEQDIQLGREAAAKVLQQYEPVREPALQDYVTRIGSRLASQPEAAGYPYTFTFLHARQVNAFALPGGPVFVFAELALFADNEAQFAGVLAHEISHVALRHGTNQLSKSQLLQLPAAMAGAALPDGALGQILQIGLGVGLNGLFLHYSREAESEADALGARIMAEAGWNPIEMARFFEKLQQKGGPGVPEFLSDHPSPGNRIKAVEQVIRNLPSRRFGFDTGEFRRVQELIRRLPPPPPPRQQSDR